MDVRWSPTAMPASSRRSIETGSSMPSARPTAAHSSITARASSTACGASAISPSVAPVSAVAGLKATLPTSLSHSSRRTSASTGHFRPPAANAAEIARQRPPSDPSGSPIVKRVPSMCRITPGATSSVAGYGTQPTTRSGANARVTTPPGSTVSSTVSRNGPANDWKNHQGTPF